MRERSWTEQQLKKAVKQARSYRQVLSALGLAEAGGNYSQIKKYIHEYNIKIDHFVGQVWNKGLKYSLKSRRPLSDFLVKNGNYQSYKLKIRLFQEDFKKPQCEICGWKERALDGRLPLELDHINGDSKDNRLENLRILCPNCHSLQTTHRGLNKKGKK